MKTVVEIYQEMLACFEQLLQLLGDKPLLTIRTVIGHNIEIATGFSAGILQDNHILIPKSVNHIHLGTHLVQLFRLGISNRRTQAAANHRNGLEFLQL